METSRFVDSWLQSHSVIHGSVRIDLRFLVFLVLAGFGPWIPAHIIKNMRRNWEIRIRQKFWTLVNFYFNEGSRDRFEPWGGRTPVLRLKNFSFGTFLTFFVWTWNICNHKLNCTHISIFKWSVIFHVHNIVVPYSKYIILLFLK